VIVFRRRPELAELPVRGRRCLCRQRQWARRVAQAGGGGEGKEVQRATNVPRTSWIAASMACVPQSR